MEPLTTVAGTLTLVKSAAELTRKLHELQKGLKDREAKQQVDEILDRLRELKQSASELEDANRDLREKLRFKSDEFEFRNPYWYHKAHPDQRLCPKCFSRNVVAHMSDASDLCLVCREYSY
jgi:predicted nuclease with TOPRIM domain